MKQVKLSCKESPEKKTHEEPITWSHDTGAMLYQLNYESSLEAGQVRVQFIPVV